MANLQDIPGMKEGHRWRNVIVGIGYAFVILIVIGAIAGPEDAANGQDGSADGGTVTTTAPPTVTDGGGGASGTPTTSPTPTPTVSPSPSPTPTPSPTSTPVPEPEPQEFTGSGQAVTNEFSVDGGLTTFDMQHRGGTSNFQVELIDTETGETVELLANEIGEWQGLDGLYVPEGSYVLDINADGSWDITVSQPRPTTSDIQSLPVQESGEYPTLIGPVQFDGLTRIQGSYQGDSNFAVWVIDVNGRSVDLLYNEIGQFEGETTFGESGVGYIRVEATGSWSITAESG